MAANITYEQHPRGGPARVSSSTADAHPINCQYEQQKHATEEKKEPLNVRRQLHSIHDQQPAKPGEPLPRPHPAPSTVSNQQKRFIQRHEVMSHGIVGAAWNQMLGPTPDRKWPYNTPESPADEWQEGGEEEKKGVNDQCQSIDWERKGKSTEMIV